MAKTNKHCIITPITSIRFLNMISDLHCLNILEYLQGELPQQKVNYLVLNNSSYNKAEVRYPKSKYSQTLVSS